MSYQITVRHERTLNAYSQVKETSLTRLYDPDYMMSGKLKTIGIKKKKSVVVGEGRKGEGG